MNNHDPHLHDREKQSVALFSMLASAGLAALKFMAAVTTGSLGLLTEAIHSLVDFGATVLTLFAVKWSSQPADEDHQFGHAKIENVAALIETMILFGTSIFITYAAIVRLLTTHENLTLKWWAFAILLISIAVDLNRSKALRKTAKLTSSPALAADAVHFESDMWSSLAVLVGLAGVWLGFLWADSVVALLVAGYIAWIAWKLGSGTLNTLLDAAPAGVAADIRNVAEKQNGVLAVKQLRIRPAGPTLFVNLDVNVPRLFNLSNIAELKTNLIREIQTKQPSADISITTSPVALDSETAFDKIGLIAAQKNASIHHITVQQIKGRMAVSFDLEVDGATPLSKAHDQATALEEAIRAGLGGDVEVESHIEPQPVRLLSGQPASAQQSKRLETILRQLAKAEKSLSDVHNVRVRTTDAGLYVHYHCRFAPTATIDAVHLAVDKIESGIKAKIKNISRVIAHAEPLGGARHKL